MYIVHYQKHAARRLIRMPLKLARRVRDRIETIANDPYQHHPNVTRLRGQENCFRLRFGDWRVVYALDKERNLLLVAKIDQKGQVYER